MSANVMRKLGVFILLALIAAVVYVLIITKLFWWLVGIVAIILLGAFALDLSSGHIKKNI